MPSRLKHRIRRGLGGGVVLSALLLIACAPGESGPGQRTAHAIPANLPLDIGEDLSVAEFSSLCWWGDDLVILPQYPEFVGQCVFVLSRDSIARAIAELEAGREVHPLRPRRIPTSTGDIPDTIGAYDGFEAIVIRGDRCFVLAEFGNATAAWGARLVSGSVERTRTGIRFEHIASAEIRGPSTRPNFTAESLIISGNECWVISELNGASLIDRPVLHRYSLDLVPLDDLPMPALEYRVTDATGLDLDGRFSVLNVFWPPDAGLVLPEVEPGPVERIIPLRRIGDRIELDRSRPVLDLRGSRVDAMHNWEGVARWGQDGFLLVTDDYPENVLAYVAGPE